MKKVKTIFAKRFNQFSPKQLTYVLFGSEKQFYLAHYLSDDESSFDQILAVQLKDPKLKEAVIKKGHLLVQIPIRKESMLQKVRRQSPPRGVHHKWRLPFSSKEKGIFLHWQKRPYQIKISAPIYYNENSDLEI